MTGTDLKQRLVAILAADAAGYSRLMSLDERGTVAALDAARSVFQARTVANQGNIVDTAGDSVLAVFDTAAGALNAALEIQARLDEAGQDLPLERRMLFRIGIHLGDVMVKTDGSIYGDGVNVAARLQALAEPGQITVSDAIHGAVRGKVDATFFDQGEQQVKNIEHPVRAYRVQTGGAGAEVPTSKRLNLAAEIDLSLPDKPSIAVLPFTNMSGDPEQEYFTDGITEDIITELSRFHSLFVIARNSSFTYKGKPVDVRTVSKELGVRYVLEGSIRKSANRIRVTGQLIDALTGNHIWAERYDRVLEDVFEVQEEVTRAIVAAIAPHIDASETQLVYRVRPGSLSAYELAMRGWRAAWIAFGGADQGARDQALKFARDALSIDPRCGAALRTIAFAQWQHIWFNTALSVTASFDEGVDASTRAIAIDSGDHMALFLKGRLLFYAGQHAAGLEDMRRAHDMNPNDALTLSLLGVSEALAGDPQKGIRHAMEALRLSPRDPSRFAFLNVLGWAYFSAADYANSMIWARRSIGEAPHLPAPNMCLVLSHVGLGEIDQAKVGFQSLNRGAAEFVKLRLAGQWMSAGPEYRQRATTFLRVAAGLEDPSAADAVR